MLRITSDLPSLTAADHHALDMLVDLSRVLRTEASIDCVQLRVMATDAEALSLSTLASRGWTISRAPGEIRIERALLRAMMDVAGLEAEHRSVRRDRFGRVPSTETPIAIAGQERNPVFSVVAKALREAVVDAAGARPVRILAPWPNRRRWAVALSHDLDVVEKWPIFTALRLMELARKGQVGRLGRVVWAAAKSLPQRPTLSGARDLLAIERRHDVRSTWFVLCGTPTLRTMKAGDLTYRPEATITRRILADIAAGGHEFGLHGSFDTCADAELLTAQRERLEALLERRVTGVRQHYLRMSPGITHRAMREAGFTFDSTCGFADRNGFRLGVADVFGAWDPERSRAAGIAEVPFAWMDRALSKYQRIEDPERWVDDGLELADRCRDLEGLWVGIWHPNLTTPLGFPGALDAYDTLVRSLVAREPHIAPIGDLVRWRVARSNARAIGIHANGSTAVVNVSSGIDLALEDANGRPIPCLMGGR